MSDTLHSKAHTTCLGCRDKIELVLNSRVASVQRGSVTVTNTLTNQTEEIPFGACVWATGVAMHPLVKILQVFESSAKATKLDGCFWEDALLLWVSVASGGH